MRLPALPRLQIGWRLLSALLIVGLAYLLYTIWNAPAYRVLAADVKGIKRLTLQDINTVAGVAGRPIFMVEPDTVQQELIEAFPELSAVEVEVSLPARVTVKVEERQPIIRWVQDDQETWIDSSGVAFPARGEADGLVRVNADTAPPGLPKSDPEDAEAEEGGPEDPDTQVSESGVGEIAGIAAGEEAAPAPFLPAELLNAILLMAGEAPEGKPLVYTSDHGLGWKDKRGWEVYFGTSDEDMDMKLAVYQQIIRRLKKDDVQPVFISVEYVHAPYYRLDR
jgi:hypothetical protein